MNRVRLYSLIFLACLPLAAGLTTPTLYGGAPDAAVPDGTVAASPAAVAALQPKAAEAQNKDEKPRFKDADEVTEGMQKEEGLITLFRYEPSDTKHDPEKLLAMIPKQLLGEDMLLAISMARGPMAGFQWGDQLVRWQVVGDQVKVVVPNTNYVRKANTPVDTSVERTYTDSYLTATPIVAMSKRGDPVIDLEKVLKSDLASVSQFGGNVRPELSTWRKVKVFPDNALLEVDLALQSRGGGEMVGVTYALRRLPRVGTYTPRAADPRVGYFLTAQQDWTKPPNERETFVRYIHRWKLEKQDPSLELSPPKEPIVFIIEKTVPIRWRRYVHEGIAEWNKAFEKIGFVNAIVVQQQTDSNEYADYDPEDARYNFLRWSVTGSAFAMGPSRVDPRTGEILDADIIFDDAFVRAWLYQFDLYGPTAMADVLGPGLRTWLEAQPEVVPEFLQRKLAEEADDPRVQQAAQLEAHLQEQGHCTCGYARGMQQQLAMAQLAMLATGSGQKKIPEHLIGEAVREIVTHEVGHTLGLRHNFKASSWLSMDEIKRRRDQTDLPTTASVMDYNPLLFFAGDKLESVKHFVTPVLGPYDDWAIEYGYAVPQGKSEDVLLKEVLAKATQPENNYATDEDTMWVYSPDPLVNRYDLSENPRDWAQARISLVDELMGRITDWAIEEGEPRYHLTRAFNVLFTERARNLQFVARQIGGQYFFRDHQGDPNARPAFVLVDPATQRQALAYLTETVFDDEFFRVSPALLNLLAPSRWSHWNARPSLRIDYPIHDRILSLQATTFLSLAAPPVLQRIYDAELKATGEDKLTTAEVVTAVRDAIWRQLDTTGSGPYTDAQPLISSIARNLQRLHLEFLLDTVQTPAGALMSPDIQAMHRLALKDLSAKIGTVLDGNEVDFASRAHLDECKSRIDRVLEAQFQAR